jgi:predicted phage-related endonuclease
VSLETLLAESLRIARGEPASTELPARRIGGTDIGKLLGLSRYGGPRSVYDRIILGVDQPMNPRMARGIREEPRIRALFVERTGAVLAPHPGIIQHPEHEFATVSPDDFAWVEGVDATNDYKSVSTWGAHQWGPDGSDTMPEHISCQLHWAMEVGGKEHARVFAAFGVDETEEVFDIKFTRLYRLQRDPELGAAMLSVAARFWTEHIVPRIPPPPDPKPSRKPKSVTTEVSP